MISTVTLNPAVDNTFHVSRLAPNDANRVSRQETDAGGKGVNCARMLHELGAETTALTFLGGKTGEFVRAVLEREGVALEFVPTAAPTRTNVMIEETSGKAPTSLNSRGGPIEHSELVSLFEKTKDLSRRSSWVVFGGSVPLGINQDVYMVLGQIAANSGAKVALDADGEALVEGLKCKPFMIKPNRAEAERLLGATFASRADVARGALQLAERGIELVVISLGSQGAIACYEGSIYDATPPEVKSISTIGSGDSLIAGVLWGLEQDAGIEDAMRLGCAAGAATAMSSGAEIGRRSDIDTIAPQVKVCRLEPAPG